MIMTLWTISLWGLIKKNCFPITPPPQKDWEVPYVHGCHKMKKKFQKIVCRRRRYEKKTNFFQNIINTT